jgi:hypothetical protein
MPRHPTARDAMGWEFNFPPRDGVHYLVHPVIGRLGSQISATFVVERDGRLVESDPCAGSQAAVRLFFQRRVPACHPALGCTVKDVHEILDEYASEVLTPHNRARVLSIELQRLDHLHRIFHKHAVETQDPASGTLCVKISERKACLLGLNAPVRLDATQLTDQQLQKSSTERIREVLDCLRGIEPPKPESEDPDKLN